MLYEVFEGYEGKPREACGVVGVFHHEPTNTIAYDVHKGLSALQHRGQDAAGIVVGDGESTFLHKDQGLVTQVFHKKQILDSFGAGIAASGQVRYGTVNSSDVHLAAQPIPQETNDGKKFYVNHNGNITNVHELCTLLGTRLEDYVSDTELAAHFMRSLYDQDPVDDGLRLTRAITEASKVIEGAFCFVVSDKKSVVAVRDKRGVRPLFLGKFLGTNDYAIASETVALEEMGTSVLREVSPGEVVTLSEEHLLHTVRYAEADPKICAMEYAYFARPDGELGGERVHAARRLQGKLLAEIAPVEADIVIGVPDSGIPAASGYSLASGIPTEPALIKNRYIARTFIAPTQAEREALVRRKLNFIPELVAGKRVVLVDDSVVRGTTMEILVRMCREAGAVEVHLRVCTPPYRWPCHYGIATADRDELLAVDHTEEEICRKLNLNSLAYITPEGLIASTGQRVGSLCMACFDGNYPTAVPVAIESIAR